MVTRSASLDLKAAADSWNIRRTLSGSSSVAGCQPETVDTIRARSSSSRRSGSRPEIQSQSSDDSLESDSERSTESFGAILKKSNRFFLKILRLDHFYFLFWSEFSQTFNSELKWTARGVSATINYFCFESLVGCCAFFETNCPGSHHSNQVWLTFIERERQKAALWAREQEKMKS